jgi:hypothetical protein
MKQILFFLLSLVTTSGYSQNADEVIQKYTNAIGGLAAINAIKTMKMTGTVTAQGYDLPITLQIINGKAVRSDIDAAGQMIINAYKDGKGWKINPFTGATTATDMTSEELSDFKTQSMLASNLMDYKARGHKVEYLGGEDVDGVKTHKIKLTTKDDNKVTTYFVSTTDNMLIKSVSTRNIQGQDMEIETYHSNVKDFNGLKFALTRIQKVSGQVLQEINFKDLQFNVTVDEKIFDKQ